MRVPTALLAICLGLCAFATAIGGTLATAAPSRLPDRGLDGATSGQSSRVAGGRQKAKCRRHGKGRGAKAKRLCKRGRYESSRLVESWGTGGLPEDDGRAAPAEKPVTEGAVASIPTMPSGANEPPESDEPSAPEAPVEPAEPPVEPPAEPGELAGQGFRFFSPSSVWNAEPPADAALDPDSEAMVAALDALQGSEQVAEKGPSINTTEYSVPIYTVPADQPTTQVRLSASYVVPALRSAWSAVPLPADAVPSAGNDRHLVVWQPSTDRLWEFWHLRYEEGTWKAEWGGAIEKAGESSGVFGPEAWPGATRSWGASATSMSIAGGLVTFEDLQRGRIEHALAMSVPNVRGGVYSSPAERTDGTSSEPFALPEGAHLRLDPSLDLASLGLPHVTMMLAEAAQRYGIFVRDGARNVTFYAQDPTPLGSNPYRGSGGYWEGSWPRRLLSYFPWQHLQVLQMDLHPSAS
jgi:hypothetical protein